MSSVAVRALTMKIGDIVTYTAQGQPEDPRSSKVAVNPEYPAIIYKIHPGNEGTVGLYAFMDDGLRLFRYVVLSEESKPETWR